MKRPVTLCLLALGIAVAAYCGVYFIETAEQRNVENNNTPELAWLKTEFNLTGEEFNRISALHSAYLPKCQNMCALVDEKNVSLKALIATGGGDSEEFQRVVKEAVQIRADCQEMMIQHFYRVSREMRPGQRERYLEWVLQTTLTASHKALDETMHHKVNGAE